MSSPRSRAAIATIAMSLLGVTSLALGVSAQTPPESSEATRCHCFGWVHGGDHGTSCSTTRAGCEAEARESSRDHTPCQEARRPRCYDDAFIGGAHMERP
ncbi:MAG: hypothetical protein J0L92_17805 [Deltaproteobacteria bacterium]|nr:hypothetical protein [Deltaproteobacteria bacterium]